MDSAIYWLTKSGHLPPHLAEISDECGNLARFMINNVAHTEQLELGLQKLLEAKDCFVRARVYELEVTMEN